MREYTDQEIEDQIARLPQDLQDAIASVGVQEELRKIVESSSIHIDEAGAVYGLVDSTLAGLSRVKEFLPALGEILSSYPKDKVLTLAEQINKNIFAKVHDSLHAINNENKEEGQEGIEVAAQAMPVSVNVAPPVATPAPTVEEKLKVPTTMPSTEKDVSYQNTDPKLKMIPSDIKARINSDPYKEPID